VSKTNGQCLYEHHHPEYLTVFADRTPWAEPMIVKNPVFHAPWRLLTAKCQATYEVQARGHQIFGKLPNNLTSR